MRPRLLTLALSAIISILTGCGSSAPVRKSITLTTGDKIQVDKLNYSVTDTEILPHLGDEAAPRLPHNRFYIVQLSVFNSGNMDLPIPGMTLIDDSGKNYEELIDGSGVPRWLGVSRHLQPNQTEQGAIVFDAPAGHYKLRLTEETDDNDVFVDIPLSFAHEQMRNETQATSEAVAAAGGSNSAAPPAAKKK